MNTGNAFTNATPGVDRALRVVLVGLLRSDRQVGDEHVGARVAEHLRHVDRLQLGLRDHVAVVGAEPVERVAALHGDAGRRHVGEPDRVVRLGEDRVGDVGADLLRVDVEGRDDADVADVVAAELDVHQAGDRLVRVGVLVVLQTLDQGRGAVAQPHDRDANLSHLCAPSCAASRGATPLAHGGGDLVLLPLAVDQLGEPRDVGLGGRARVLDQRALVVVGRAGVAQVRLDLGEPCPRSPWRRRSSSRIRVSGGRYRKNARRTRNRASSVCPSCGGSWSSSRNSRSPSVGDGVDGLAAGARAGFARDRAVALEASQRRVERPVGDPPQAPELLGQLAVELVAVHRALLQEAQDREFDHRRFRSSVRTVPVRYIGAI